MNASQTDRQTSPRHFGLDWLRIAAFAVLILYHTAMYIGPFHWVVKVAVPTGWLAYPLNAISPWRLMVLFAVSGYASAAMLGKFDSTAAFFRERSKRLLLPLLFGMTIIVPPQSWVRLVSDNGYQRSFTTFWLHDDFRFGDFLGHTLPHWEHLWFLGYLWGYTAMLAVAIALLPNLKALSTAASIWLSKGFRLLLAPLIIIIPLRLIMVKEGLSSHGMFDDFIGDIHYIPAFLLGFLLANDAGMWSAINRLWRPSLVLALVACATLMVTTGMASVGTPVTMANEIILIVADTTMAWAMVPVAFRIADHWLNRDNRWRATLAEAVFPAYLLHQTVIVLLGWYLLRFDLSNLTAFLIVSAAVVVSSALAYALAIRIGWPGILLGVANKAGQKRR